MTRLLTLVFVALFLPLVAQASENKKKADPVVDAIKSVSGHRGGDIRVVAPADFPSMPVIATKVAFRLVKEDQGVETVDPTIYLVDTSWAYQQALAGDKASVYLLASTIEHERSHAGSDKTELAALNAQLKVLRRFQSLSVSDRNTSAFLQDQIRQISQKAKLERASPTAHVAYSNVSTILQPAITYAPLPKQ